MILGIDGGNSVVKVAGPNGVDKFVSDIGEYRSRNLEETHGADDMVWEYEGHSLLKGFAGTLAEAEAEFSGSMMGDTKAHEDALLRVLLAVHRYTNDQWLQVVVGQPISRHTRAEKEKIKNMLKGRHTIKVNGVEKTFIITEAEVACEGGVALLSEQPVERGRVRIIDIGSGTVNCASVNDGRYIDRESFTLNFGSRTTKSNNRAAMARAIAAEALKKWTADDTVLVAGGIANEMAPLLQRFFPNARAISPRAIKGGCWVGVHPIYANAVACYEVGKRLSEKWGV